MTACRGWKKFFFFPGSGNVSGLPCPSPKQAGKVGALPAPSL